jgi:TIR domain
MGVFIGWSGKNTKSHQVAEALRRWLKQVIQGCEPWVSSQDIDAGERWVSELFGQLDIHKVGIVCVTKENQAEPWLNFEARTLAKQMKGDKSEESRVCPLLIDMTENDVTGPMKLLQMVVLDNDGIGMFKVLQTVNKSGTKPLSDDELKGSFDMWWPTLQTELDKMKVPEKQPEKSSRSWDDILDEILTLVRSIDKATTRQQATRILTAPVARFREQIKKVGLHLEMEKERLMFKLLVEVTKTDSALGEELADADANYDGEVLWITPKQIIPEERIKVIWKAADTLGIKVEFK